jgi:hypothetical protein
MGTYKEIVSFLLVVFFIFFLGDEIIQRLKN